MIWPGSKACQRTRTHMHTHAHTRNSMLSSSSELHNSQQTEVGGWVGRQVSGWDGGLLQPLCSRNVVQVTKHVGEAGIAKVTTDQTPFIGCLLNINNILFLFWKKPDKLSCSSQKHLWSITHIQSSSIGPVTDRERWIRDSHPWEAEFMKQQYNKWKWKGMNQVFCVLLWFAVFIVFFNEHMHQSKTLLNFIVLLMTIKDSAPSIHPPTHQSSRAGVLLGFYWCSTGVSPAVKIKKQTWCFYSSVHFLLICWL